MTDTSTRSGASWYIGRLTDDDSWQNGSVAERRELLGAAIAWVTFAWDKSEGMREDNARGKSERETFMDTVTEYALWMLRRLAKG